MTGKELAEFLKSVGAEPPAGLELDSIYQVDVGVENDAGQPVPPERLKEVLSFKTPCLMALNTMGGTLNNLVKAMRTDITTLSTFATPEEREEIAHTLLHKALSHVYSITEAALEAMPCQQDEDNEKTPEQPACLH